MVSLPNAAGPPACAKTMSMGQATGLQAAGSLWPARESGLESIEDALPETRIGCHGLLANPRRSKGS